MIGRASPLKNINILTYTQKSLLLLIYSLFTKFEKKTNKKEKKIFTMMLQFVVQISYFSMI